MRILKYKVTADVKMPVGAEILHVNSQEEHTYMWCLVPQEKDFETRHFLIYATGEEMRLTSGKYIATLHDRQFVWHLYEVA